MADPATYKRGAATGAVGRAFYTVGRGGALGDVSGVVVASAMTFFPVPMVVAEWDTGRAALTPEAAVAAFCECCWGWARGRMASAPHLVHTVALLARVVDGASAAALPLFAAWREAPRPDDLPALAGHLLHVLREHRGGSHAMAVLASGLTPLEAVVGRASTVPSLSPNAADWGEPLPEVNERLLERLAAAETLTNQLVAPALSALDAAERAELTARLLAIRPPAKTG